MGNWPPAGLYTRESLEKEGKRLLDLLKDCSSVGQARKRIFDWVKDREFDPRQGNQDLLPSEVIRVRDCAMAFAGMVSATSDQRSGFSVAQALWDIAQGRDRTDLQAGFFAEMIHLIQGVEGRAPFHAPDESRLDPGMDGREASLIRSDELDRIWEAAEAQMLRYEDGLGDEAVERRRGRRDRILGVLGGRPEDWGDWRWQVGHSITGAEEIAKVVRMSDEEREVIAKARDCHLPFGVTPYYASLMDEEASGRDRAVRAQVLPPKRYVDKMAEHRRERSRMFDFMGEFYTSPIDLVTRRYPAILILKPYNTCPQVCV